MATSKRDELRRLYENELFEFAKYVNPQYMYGDVHEEVFNWLQEDHDDESLYDILNKLLLLPRGHLKSHCLATYVAWRLTREPWYTFVYLTAGDDLATVQMSAIKSILTSSQYKLLWPNHINAEEAKRAKWSTREINLDHPERKKRRIRDYSVIIKTLGSSATGLHADELIMDDVVVPTNAYTEAGRKLVEQSVSDFASVKNTGARTKCGGTRYDEKDVYQSFIDATFPVVDRKTGEVIAEQKLWQVFEKEVEDSGDGTGSYIWPRMQSPYDEKFYGFDPQELAIKKAEYVSQGHYAQFYSQYYNDTDRTGKEKIDRDSFRYIRRKYLQRIGNSFYAFGKRLEIIAAMDCAWTDDTGNATRDRKAKKPDYTAIVAIGMDEDGFYYVLDVIQFRTSQLSKYYNELIKVCNRWCIRKAYIETNSAGKLIKQEVDKKIRDNGDRVATYGKPRSKSDGTKEERWALILDPKYEAKLVYHARCMFIHEAENQIKKARPKYDDIKDAITLGFENVKKPSNRGGSGRVGFGKGQTQTANSRFGGRR